jgi:hypothetical protein
MRYDGTGKVRPGEPWEHTYAISAEVGMRRREFLATCGAGLAGLAAVRADAARDAGKEEVFRDFDVVIAGGTTAAFAAAVASAESGAKTCLIEPTDWVGGQITSSGVPAIDEAWH